MENKRLSFATVVASPTSVSWSQSYSAGTLFVVVSLMTKDDALRTEDKVLGTIGKEILNTLEAEYFTIETKNLVAVKQAFEIAVKQAKQLEDVSLSAGLLSVVENVLYVVLLGHAKALMKRGDGLGTLLASEESQLTSGSGFLKDNDIVILETAQFANIVTKDQLKKAIDNNSPSDIAENISPLLHEQEEGAAAAIIVSYKEPVIEEVTNEDNLQDFPSKHLFFLFVQNLYHVLRYGKNYIKTNFTRRQKLFLVLALFLTLLLFGSGMFVLNQKEEAKNQALFQKVFEEAKTKYDEGQSLLALNKNLARDDFQEAKKMLLENKDKFPKKSTQEKEFTKLLEKVENSLKAASGVNISEAKMVDQNKSELLAQAIKNTPLFVTQDEKNVYTVNNDAVFTIDKKSKDKKTIIPNISHWSNVGGLGVYLGNIYVLDRKVGQIFKFTAVSSGFTKTNYLVGSPPAGGDFLQVSSLAIDGSIWVLLENGEIRKFTRGRLDDLKISGLDKPFSKTSRIFTDVETNNVYILDNGNSRIVVLSKSGVYQTQYQADVLKNAKEFDVLEKEKKIFVLSGKKVWQIDLR